MPESVTDPKSLKVAAPIFSAAKTSSHLEKLLAHAERELDAKGKTTRGELLTLYKRFLKIEDHRLRLKHYAGGGGREIARQRVDLLDVIVRHIFEYAQEMACPDGGEMFPLAVIATGGYGRGELNPFSDVDIMFLRGKGRVPAYIDAIIEQVLYLLWDVGFKVGHATRSLAETLTHANADMISRTAMLESRFLAGDRELYKKFKTEFVSTCVLPFQEAYLKWRQENQADRHAKFGGTVFMQEPNVKSGCGGLRDYQNLLWVSYFKEGVRSAADLVTRRIISEADRRALEKAYDFLLRVRTELHYLSGRASDALTIYLQGQVATKFHYPQKHIIERSEAFMRDYYQHTRTIFRISNLVLEYFLALEAEKLPAPQRLLSFLRKKPVRAEHFDGFIVREGKLYFEARDIFNEDPFRLIRVFQHAQQRRLGISAELQQLIHRRIRLVDRTFQYARAARETFFAILSRKGEVGRILRLMHEVDFLGRYIPEFGALTCLVQHEFFHRYTADEHTLVCIEKLDALIDTAEPKFRDYQSLFQRLEDPFILYLALLLHDTGKADSRRNHAETGAINAAKVAARLQLSSERRKELVFLIDDHMLLSDVAQRQNIEDESTIAEFAKRVKNQTNLDALMLLTLADGQGTSDKSWSDWKESLVWRVYRSTQRYLVDGTAFFEQQKHERDEMRAVVTKKLAKDYAEEIEAHFQFMPERYFQTFDVPEIVGHLRLFRELFGQLLTQGSVSLEPVIKWVAHPEQGHSEVWVCTWDRQDLLSRIAASFAIVPLNILSADIFTRQDNLVLDVFRVCDTQFGAVTYPKEIAKVEKILRESLLAEDYDFTALLAKARKASVYQLSQEIDFPTRIVINNESNPRYSVVEVQCPDRLGLLHDLLRAFSGLGINIITSRITTEKGAAIDTFYVTDTSGKKIGEKNGATRLTKALNQAVNDNQAREVAG